MAPTITSPLRLLILSAPETPHPAFLRDPSHHEIRNPYYNALIPIWRDTLPATLPAIEAFRDEWTCPEAAEVVQAVGAWVVCFKKPRDKAGLEAVRSALTTIHQVIKHHTSSSYLASESLLLAVGMPQTINPRLELESEEWEDLCRECGSWEWIDEEMDGGSEASNQREKEKRNEFGERVGISRLKEALEAHEWEGGDLETLSDDLGYEDGFGAEAAQMEQEMMGLRMSVQGEEGSGEGGDEGVEELENMMLKVRAIKEMGADMPEAERRKFAAKAVRDVMKTL